MDSPRPRTTRDQADKRSTCARCPGSTHNAPAARSTSQSSACQIARAPLQTFHHAPNHASSKLLAAPQVVPGTTPLTQQMHTLQASRTGVRLLNPKTTIDTKTRGFTAATHYARLRTDAELLCLRPG